MPSPNTFLLRQRQRQLTVTPRYLVKRELIPVGEGGRKRLRISVADGFAFDELRRMAINPARHMSEADRRAVGIRRNGRPRRAPRAAQNTEASA